MLKIFKQPIKIKTPDGYKTAYGIRKLKKPAIKIEFSDNTFITASTNHKFINEKKTVLANSLKVGDKLNKKIITKINNVGEIDVYDLTDVDGNVYYTNGILSHNCEFLGSSDTLVSGESLREIEQRVQQVKPVPQNVLNTGEMYKPVEPNHNYIITCDPSKDGIDDFSVNVVDVTKFPFEQVFTANLQVDYLIMPEHLNELGMYYNEGLMIIENNEGAGQSIADVLFSVYEYPNIYKDKNIDGRIGYKKYPGFRTTQKSRPLILNMLKIFIEEGKLIVNSQTTLNQLYTFTKRKNGTKYEAENGYKDDAVMSLALLFAPFMEIKTFDNYELFTKHLRTIDSNLKTADFLSVLDIGAADDGSDEYNEQRRIEEQRRFIQEEGLGAEFSAFEGVSEF